MSLAPERACKIPALPELTSASEVTACTACNCAVLVPLYVPAFHSPTRVWRTAGKALVNTTSVETQIRPNESGEQE